MPAPKSKAALSQMIELSEDELDQTNQTTFDNTVDSAIENVEPDPPTRPKGRGRPKTTKAPAPKSTAANKVTKARATTRRTSGGAAARKTKGNKRSALAEREVPNGNDTEEVEEFEDEAPAKRRAKRQAQEETMDDEAVVDVKPAKKERARATKTNATSRQKTSKRAPSPEPARAIPETQQPLPDPMDVEPSTAEDVTVLPVEQPAPPQPKPVSRAHHRTASRDRDHANARPASTSRQPSVPRSRAGSVSDPERRTHDPALRRKLGDVTKKFENLQIKYSQLKDIGLRDAESNFEKLRKSSEQRARDQDDIIASQKKEIAILRGQQTDSRPLKAKVAGLESENQKLAAENSRLHTELKANDGALSDAQSEAKSLTAKLAAAKESVKAAEEAAKAAAAASKAPASASKAGPQKGAAAAAAAAANTQASADLAVMKLKEELYSDLTGLMVRNVKKVDGEDVFDCIQTGRNGTLRFHLSIPPPQGGAEGGGYDDVEFAYTPLLDDKNDRDLFSILPDYLTEDICFPRNSAARFYAKVLDSMSRKVVVEADE